MRTSFGSSSAEGAPSGPLATLGVWDANLARLGAEIVGARMRLIADLSPLVGKAYEAVARGATRDDATMVYRCSFPAAAGADQHELEQGLLSELERLRGDELDRGISLAGPHRDDLVLSLGDLPAGDPPTLELCAERLAAAGLRVAAVDVTSPDVALGPFRVARVLGTDMQPIHFGERYRRLANPRLDQLLAGRPINPDPHPLA